MADTIHVNGIGRAHLNSLVDAGKVDNGEWNAPTGGKPNQYLAVDTAEGADTEAHYKYPFSASGDTVNKKALASIESYATTNNQPEIAAAAKSALDRINAKSKNSEQFAEAGKGATLKNVEIFSAGTWRGSREVKVDGSMLDRIVANFANLNSKVSGFGVPIKLGHNDRIGEPAYGWMSDVQRIGDTLVADFSDVDPQIVDAISKRRYNSVSVEIYPVVRYAGQVLNDVLGGVALLGAEWPAVKGLKPLSSSLFAEQPEKVELKEKDTVKTFTEQEHADLIAAEVAKTVAAEAVKLAAEKARADAAEAELAKFRDEAEKAEVANIIKTAEAKGQIVPANKKAVEEFAEKVRTAATGDARKALLATFKGFVEAMPAKVKFGEAGAAAAYSAAAEGQKAADELDAKVKAHMAANAKSDYATSLAAVLADPANAELKTAYAQEM